jgi:hypothetical protein
MTRGGGNREPSGSFEARQQRLRRQHPAAMRGQRMDPPPQGDRPAPSLGRRIWRALSGLWRRSP